MNASKMDFYVTNILADIQMGIHTDGQTLLSICEDVSKKALNNVLIFQK